jgi:hypothetical protein
MPVSGVITFDLDIHLSKETRSKCPYCIFLLIDMGHVPFNIAEGSLSDFIIETKFSIGDYEYKLCGVVDRKFDNQQSHYRAHVRFDDMEQWYFFDDNRRSTKTKYKITKQKTIKPQILAFLRGDQITTSSMQLKAEAKHEEFLNDGGKNAIGYCQKLRPLLVREADFLVNKVKWLRRLLPDDVFERAKDVDTFKSINNIMAILEDKEMESQVRIVFVNCFELGVLRTLGRNLEIERDNAEIEKNISLVSTTKDALEVTLIRYL